MQLVWPSEQYLPGYVEALQRGWSPNREREEAVREELQKISSDRGVFLQGLIDRI